MPILGETNIRQGSAAAGGGHIIEGSGLFNGTNGKLTRTIGSAGNRRTFILEAAYKRGGTASSYLTQYTGGSDTFYWYLSSDQVYVQDYDGSNRIELKSDALLRDFSAWYHLIVAVDTTQGTNTNRVKAWLNGVQLTWAASPGTYPAQDLETRWNQGSKEHQIGFSSTTYSPDYWARAAAYDGQTMTDPVTDGFGEYDDNGNWVLLDVSGKTFGTTGFLIEGGAAFTNGTDSSGNSQNFTKGGTITDVDDSPTDKASDNFGNYWTLNPLASTETLTNGKNSFTAAANFTTYATAPAIPMSGKWYFEVKAVGGDSAIGSSASYDAYLGLVSTDIAIPTGSHTSNADLWVIANWNPTPSGQKNNNSTATYTPTAGFADNSIIMVAIDMDNNAMWFGNDNTWAGSATASEIAAGTTTNAAFTSANNSFGSKQMMPYIAAHSDLATYNFGATAFAHTPPTGFKALYTANLPAPTKKNASDYFFTKLYTANNTDNHAITGVGFQPDWVWIKDRDTVASHVVFDSVRGAQSGAGFITVNTTDSEGQGGNTNTLKSFDSDGFTLDDDSADQRVNYAGEYVAWCWKAGASASSNGTGSITSTVNVADHGGFSIITYTGNGSAGATIGHGLSKAADLQFFRQRNGTNDWHVGTNVTGSIIGAELNNNTATVTAAVTAFNATTTALAASGVVNDNTDTYVSYAFARTPGLIACGKYVGNGSTNGSYVVVDDGGSGFRPAWVMIHNISQAGNWFVYDNQRNTTNVVNKYLIADGTAAEATSGPVQLDFTANGFKLRSTNDGTNATDNYIYLAFAEQPFGGDGVSQAKAR